MLADDQTLQAMKKAASALIVHALYDDRRTQIAKAVVPRLASLLQETADADLKSMTAWILMVLAMDEDLRPMVAEAALPALCDLLHNEASGRWFLAAFALLAIAELPAMRTQISSLAVPRLLSLLQESVEPFCLDCADKLFQQLIESSDMCVVVAAAAMPQLCSGLQASNSSGRMLAALYLTDLARHAPIRRSVMEASLTGLVALIQDQTAPVCRMAAAGALHAIAESDELHIEVADAALPTLLAFLQEGSRGSETAAAVIAELACSPALQIRIHNAALPGLISLLQATACPNGGMIAAIAIKNIATDITLRQPLVESALPALASLLTDLAVPECWAAAADAIGVISSDGPESRSRQVADAALIGLVAVLRKDDLPEGQVSAAQALGSIAASSDQDLKCRIFAAASEDLARLGRSTTNAAGSAKARWALPQMC